MYAWFYALADGAPVINANESRIHVILGMITADIIDHGGVVPADNGELIVRKI